MKDKSSLLGIPSFFKVRDKATQLLIPGLSKARNKAGLLMQPGILCLIKKRPMQPGMAILAYSR